MTTFDPQYADTKFWPHVLKTDGCWLWQRKPMSNGYGCLTYGPRHSRVHITSHRYSWQLHFGVIEQSQLVCHECDNPLCVRPSHLFLGTYDDNNSDMVRKGRSAKGSRHSHAKLTEEDVLTIRKRLANGERNIDIARDYPVNPDQITVIKTRRGWAHI